MSVITKITEQKRNRDRRNVFLDGKFAFGCNILIIAKFQLRPGMRLDEQQIREIEFGDVKQECMAAAMQFLSHRLHSRAELYRKLARREWGETIIDSVMEDLTRMGYIDDERFARAKALAAAQQKQHGRRRAFIELIRSGVSGDVATRALDEVYSQTNALAMARELAGKHAARLRNLDPTVARRRLAGLLRRRGFDYDDVKPVIDEVLGADEPQPKDTDQHQPAEQPTHCVSQPARQS